MERQEMIDFLKARGLFERGMNQLVGWELMTMVEEAMDMGLPTAEEINEMDEPAEEPKEEPVVEVCEKCEKESCECEAEKPKAKAKPKAKPKAKKAKK